MQSAIGRVSRAFTPSMWPMCREMDGRFFPNGYLSSIGIPEDRLEVAIDRLIPVWRGPSLDLWRRVLGSSIINAAI